MLKYSCIYILFVFIYFYNVNCETLSKDLVNKKIDRKIDIASQLVKINTKITLENGGTSVAKIYHYCLSKEESQNLAYISSSSGGSVLQTKEVSIPDKKEFVFYKIHLRDSLQAGKSVIIDVEIIFGNSLAPYPKSIQQGEKQLVEYNANHYYLSPYSTTTQTSTVTLLSPNVVSYSRLKPSSHTDSSINYGPYEAVPPFSYDAMKVHYENNSPFLVVSHIDRLIEVSHWGSLAVEENIDVVHAGAKLKGPFSRYDYQREHNTFSSVKSFKTILPASAKDVYYRDEIGNISTSNMKVQEDVVEVELRPRFPLFGGWKTRYTLGYNVPSYEYLYNLGNSYILKMRFIDHIFDDMVVDEATLKVMLPEGVSGVKLSTPYSVTREPDYNHATYLDTTGRLVIVAHKKNLVENHIQDFELSYNFPSYYMFKEPFLVVVFFMVFFGFVIIYVRLDLTLSKDDATEAKMRISSHCEMVHSHHDKRARLYEKLELEINTLKHTKDVNASQMTAKKILSAIRDETQTLSDLAVKIKADSADYAEKVNELQKQDKSLLDILTQQLSNVEKLVGGKMNKQTYLTAESTCHKKKESVMDKIKSCLATI